MGRREWRGTMEWEAQGIFKETGLIGIDVFCWNEMGIKVNNFPSSSCCVFTLHWTTNLIFIFLGK